MAAVPISVRGVCSRLFGVVRPLLRRAAVVVSLLALGAVSGACSRDALAPYVEQLDAVIAEKPLYDAEKERRIKELHLLLGVEGLTGDQEYGINERLYREFKKYKLDSAIYYVSRNLRLARRMDNSDLACRSALRLARLYSSGGRCIEARHILDTIRRSRLSPDLLQDYYRAYSDFCQHYAVLSNQPSYYRQANLYADSLMRTGDTLSVRCKLLAASRLDRWKQRPDSVETCLLRLFDEVGPEDARHAEAAHLLSVFYAYRGDGEQCRKFEILAAITDARHSIKENTSFQSLARMYYDRGDFSRAFKYTHAAIEDTFFSNIQFRMVQISELYAIISSSLQVQEMRTKRNLQASMLLLFVFFVVLLSLFVYSRRQTSKLDRIRNDLSQANGELTRVNDELLQANELLSDANAVKIQYIAQFFNICSVYIDKMDEYRRSLKKLSENRKFDLLSRQLKSTTRVQKELEELYRNFDIIFLNLYPTFVDDFNALLQADERIVLRAGNLLNKELRIYALLRLGITDNVKIASFLRCSMSTVYNYRSKMRNRAAVPRDEFEDRVMRIGLIHENTG